MEGKESKRNAGALRTKEQQRGKRQGEEREGLFNETTLERGRDKKGGRSGDSVHAAIRKEAEITQRGTVTGTVLAVEAATCGRKVINPLIS